VVTNYIPIFLVLLAASIFGAAVVFSSRIFGPLRPNKVKIMPYESGKDPIGTTNERISIKYYLVAMLFIVFDIEVIYVYPWAVEFKKLFAQYGLFAFVPMFIFLVVLELGFVYIFMKGGLRWD